MHINSITNNTFEGKVRFDNNISKSKIDYVEKILDFPLNGSTLRKRISKGSYDVTVISSDTKKTIHPRVTFYSKFEKLKECYWDKYKTFNMSSKSLRIDETVEKGAKHLEQFLDQFEKYKSYTNYSYNSFGEKICAYFKKFFGIRK
jgi:hypothetical protein